MDSEQRRLDRLTFCFQPEARKAQRIVQAVLGVSGSRQDVFMNEEQFDGMRLVDAQTGELRYRVRDSRILDARTGQLAFRIREGARVVDAATGNLVFRIRDGVRLVDANSGTLRFRLRR